MVFLGRLTWKEVALKLNQYVHTSDTKKHAGVINRVIVV